MPFQILAEQLGVARCEAGQQLCVRELRLHRDQGEGAPPDSSQHQERHPVPQGSQGLQRTRREVGLQTHHCLLLGKSLSRKKSQNFSEIVNSTGPDFSLFTYVLVSQPRPVTSQSTGWDFQRRTFQLPQAIGCKVQFRY